MAASRIPRQLTKKYNDLLREKLETVARLKELDRELEALAYSLRVLSPNWVPPTKAPKKQGRSRLPHGAVGRGCLQALRAHGELWTPELVMQLAQRHRVTFRSRSEEEDFASAVAMALRRYERQGLLEVTAKNAKTQALRWRLRDEMPRPAAIQ